MLNEFCSGFVNLYKISTNCKTLAAAGRLGIPMPVRSDATLGTTFCERIAKEKFCTLNSGLGTKTIGRNARDARRHKSDKRVATRILECVTDTTLSRSEMLHKRGIMLFFPVTK